MGASNTMVARTQNKGETMKLIRFRHPGGGSEEAERFIALKTASSLYLALLLYLLCWI